MNQKKETEIENNRINEIDIAKGIGILCVVVGHRLLAMDISSSIINSFHMPLFFLLSGLVMRPDGRFGWIKSAKAEKKLITNYLFWAVVFIVFDIIVRMLILGEYNLTSLFLDVYMTCTLFGINVLWFVSTLAIGKILAKWVITHVKKSVAQFAIGAIIFIIVAFIAKICISVLGEIHGITRIIYYPLIMILRSIAMAGYVLCGYAMKIVVNMVLKFKLWGGSLALVILLNIFIAPHFSSYGYRSMEFGYPVMALIMGITGFVGVLGISILINYIVVLRKAFVYLGKHSLFIMLTHEHLKLGVLVAVVLAPLFADELFWLYLIVQIIVLMIVEILLCRWLEPWCTKVTDWMAGWRIFSNKLMTK